MYGEIHGEETYFLRVYVNDWNDLDIEQGYEITTLNDDSTPIVKSKKTGKFFTLSWADIINMAKEAGIDKK